MSGSLVRRCYCQLAALILAAEAARLRDRPLVETALRLRAGGRFLYRKALRADISSIASVVRSSASATRLLERLGLGLDNHMTRSLIAWALLEPACEAVLHVGVRIPRAGSSADGPLEDHVWITLAGAPAAGELGLGTGEGCRELWCSRDL